MEIFDLIDRIKEDKHLRTRAIFYFLIEMFEDSSDDILVHLFFRLADPIVIFNTLEGNLFSQLLLDHLVDVELNHIFGVLIVELNEFLLHRGGTSDHIGTVGLCDFEDLS